MGGAGVPGQDEPRARDEVGGPPATTRRTGRPRRRARGADRGGLVAGPGDDDLQAVRDEGRHDGGPPLDGPAAGGGRRPGVHHHRSVGDRTAGPQPQVLRAAVRTPRRHEPAPARDFVLVPDPRRPRVPVRRETQQVRGGRGGQDVAARVPPAVQVDREVTRSAVWQRFQVARHQDLVDDATPGEELPDRARCRQDEACPREPAPQPRAAREPPRAGPRARGPEHEELVHRLLLRIRVVDRPCR